MPDIQPLSEVANEWRCLLLALVSRERYVIAHVADLVAANNVDDTWKQIIADPVKFAPREVEWRKIASEGCTSIRSRLGESGCVTLAACAAASVLGLLSGAVHPTFPMSAPKTLTFVGTSLMAWATVLGLGTPPSTWGGPALHDRIIPKLFLVIFLPGAVLALFGSLL
jgi:hypothetical protein